MNGRIYDARIARFLQADPIIQEPYMTQSLNRYSYVWNNPLNATDPSGYEAFSLIAFIYAAITAATVAYVVSDIIATVGINNGWSQGTIQGLSLIATFIAAIVSGGASLAADTIASLTTLQIVQVVAVSGIIGGITSSLQGGKFGHGFISGGIGGYLGVSKGFQSLSVGLKSLTKIVVGGTLSEITGGKFANGAAFAAASVALGLIAGEIKAGRALNGSRGAIDPNTINEDGLKNTNLDIAVEDIFDEKGKLIQKNISISGYYDDETGKFASTFEKVVEAFWGGEFTDENGVKYVLTTDITNILEASLSRQIHGADFRISAKSKCEYACATSSYIEVNSDFFEKFQIDTIGIAHEFGHVIGFYHFSEGSGNIQSYDDNASLQLSNLKLLDKNY